VEHLIVCIETSFRLGLRFLDVLYIYENGFCLFASSDSKLRKLKNEIQSGNKFENFHGKITMYFKFSTKNIKFYLINLIIKLFS
jgi:hypothetical protein